MQCLVSASPEDQNLRFIAALVLKNIVKNFVVNLTNHTQTSQAVVQNLLSWMVAQEGSLQEKKVMREATVVLAAIGFQEFIRTEVDKVPVDPNY